MSVQTFQSAHVAKNFGSIINSALSGIATIVKRYDESLAVVISHKEYQRFKALEDTLLWQESKRIADKNDSEGTWVDGDVVEARMRALREMAN